MQQQVPNSGWQPTPPASPVPAKPDRWAMFRGLSWWQVTLAVLPLVLIPLGGLVGGALGALAMVVNLKLARLGMPALVKALVMLAVVVVAFAAWVGVVNLLLT